MSEMVIGGRTAPPLSALSGKTAPEKKSAPGSFGTILEGMVKDAETLQQKANEEITKVQTTQSGSIHEVMIAMEKAYPNITGEAIAAAFHTITEYKGLQGTFSVQKNGETIGVTQLGIWKGGKLAPYTGN